MKGLTTSLYNLLPVPFQNIAISAFGYKWKKRRFGGIFNDEVENFKKRESFTTQQWNYYQLGELRKLLVHSYSHVPYYKQLFQQHGITENLLRNFTFEDLSRIPFLTKQDLRQYGTTTLISNIKEKKGAFFASSGSTGTPVNILFSHKMHQTYSAMAEARCRNWAGLTFNDARGMIGGRRIIADAYNKGPFYRYNFFEKQVYFSAYHISSSTAPNYLSGIEKYKVQYMTGYAMSNYILARFFNEQNLKPPPMKAVITSSEKLTIEMRELISKVYDCKVYDSYSGVEACTAITECEHGSLHISPDVGITEILDENGLPSGLGQKGEIVATGLLNMDQPLIRYRTGDFVRISPNNCICGREMPVVEEIYGRDEDMVIGKDGREMVRFHGIFINIPSIIEGQVVQLDYDSFELNIVAQKLSDDEKKILAKRMKSQLGDVDVKINLVDRIPRAANGKYKAVISKIKKKQ